MFSMNKHFTVDLTKLSLDYKPVMANMIFSSIKCAAASAAPVQWACLVHWFLCVDVEGNSNSL